MTMGLPAADASLGHTGHLERSLRVSNEARSLTREVLDELRALDLGAGA